MNVDGGSNGYGADQLTPEELDCALSAAFPILGPSEEGDARTRGPLDACEETPRIPTNIEADSRPRQVVGAGGRFVILGEIGRGGLGVVLRCRDVDLDRDVAVKVLHARHGSDRSMVQKLVEEARVGGRLQHPGIVPVYETGLDADGRPFFAMKLVDGATLGQLLRRRATPQEQRGRMLAVFEQICQAVGYAHARGVVHRDLKPSNVMVGAFGEVQVVDWGLARRIASAEPGGPGLARSIAGSPSYMAPEQARGEDHLVDARSDVFGLGAILCEILAGRPPFLAASSDAARRAAASGELSEAFASLAVCGADPEVVALARLCLDPDRAKRPADGAAVAVAIGRYLASVEQRARDAEVQIARAESMAAGERRRRRLAVALSCSVLVTVLLGCGAWLWFAELRRARVEQAEGRVQSAIERALEVVGAARAAPTMAAWQEATSAAREAVALAAAEEVGSLVRIRALAVLGQTEDGAAAARATAERRARDDRVRLRLQQVREERGDHWTSEVAGADAEYAAAFAELGIDVAEGDVEEVARRIRDHAMAASLLAALDDWVRMLQRRGVDADRDWRVLARVSMAAEVDPVRRRLREAWFSADRDGLRGLATEHGRADLPPSTLTMLAYQLEHHGDAALAKAVLLDAQRRHPDDFWVNHDLALQMPEDGPERMRFLTAALALRPQSVHIRIDLAHAREAAGDFAAAEAEAEAAVVLRPDLALAHGLLGRCRIATGDAAGAVAAYREAVRLQADEAKWHDGLAQASFHAGEIGAAIDAGFTTLALHGPDAAMLDRLAVALQVHGESERALALLQDAVRLDPGLASARFNLAAVLHSLGRFDDAVGQFVLALHLEEGDAQTLRNLAGALLARGDTGAAIEVFRQALQREPEHEAGLAGIAEAWRRHGDAAAAETAHRHALCMVPGHVGHCAALGSLLLEQGRLADAEAVLLDGLSRQRTPALLATLGGVLQAAGRSAEALPVLQEALSLHADHCEALSNLGPVLRALDRPREAEAALRRAIEVDPENAVAHLNLGVLLERDGDLAAAERAYAAAVHLQPGLHVAWFDLGNVLERRQHFVRASIALGRAAELDPRNPVCAFRLGRALYHAGDLHGAIPPLRAASDALPEHAESLHLLADCVAQTGHPDLALGFARRAAAVLPGNKDTAFDLGRLFARLGRYDEARGSFAKAAGLGDASAVHGIRRCEHMLTLEDRLPDVVAGAVRPRSAEEAWELGELALHAGECDAAAALLERAVAAQGEHASPELLFQAAAAAVAAAFRPTRSADASPTSRLRAIATMRHALAAEGARLRRVTGSQLAWHWTGLWGWQCHPAFAGLRDEAVLASLTADVRAAIRDFWAEHQRELIATAKSRR